jgi:hypothetical protein
MQDNEKASLTEEIAVRGAELVERVKALMQDASVRRLVVRRPTGEALIEIPLAAGLGVAGVLTLMAPVLAAVGAMAALIADFRVQIERVAERDGPGHSGGPYEDADGETDGDGPKSASDSARR